jgi:hypothetical protein
MNTIILPVHPLHTTSGMSGDQTRKMLARAARLVASLAGSFEQRSPAIRELVEQVTVDQQTIIIKVRRGPLLDRPMSSALDAPSDGAIELTTAVSIKRRGVGTRLVLLDAQHNHSARCDPALVKAIARGRAWFDELVTAARDRCKSWPNAAASAAAISGVLLVWPS